MLEREGLFNPLNQIALENKYSRFVIIVCSIPEAKCLTPIQKNIIEGMQMKWKTHHNDPQLSRLDIIYLSPDDSYREPKFAPLRLIDNRSLIYIVGHCQGGQNAIQSDSIYIESNTNSNTHSKADRIRYNFSYKTLANILIANIHHTNILMYRTYRAAEDTANILNAPQRKLKICLPACNTASGSADSKTSFAEKLFDYLHNSSTKTLFSCDIIGYTGKVAPMPALPEQVGEVANILLRLENVNYGTHFHKWQFLVNDFKIQTLVPRHKPWGVEYKKTFALSRVSVLGVYQRILTPHVLNIQQSHERFETQTLAEQLLRQCQLITENTRLAAFHEKIEQIIKVLVGDQKFEGDLNSYLQISKDIVQSILSDNEIILLKSLK